MLSSVENCIKHVALKTHTNLSLTLIQLSALIRLVVGKERILGFPSCPLEETIQPIMEINSIYVSNLDTTGNKIPPEGIQLITTGEICAERACSPAVCNVNYPCIIITTGSSSSRLLHCFKVKKMWLLEMALH